MIRKLRINQKPIRSRHNRLQQLRQKGINRTNLQNIFISEDTVPKSNTECKTATINAQSVRNKDTLLTQKIITHNIDVTLITPQDIAWLHQSDLLQTGYAISTHNRPTRGGGLALLYKDMKIKKIEAQHLCMIEYAIWQVSIKNKTINILGIYHPTPKQHLTNAIFLDELMELFTTRLPSMENAMILGDFNIHIEDTNDCNSKIFVKHNGSTRPEAANNRTHPPKRKHTRPPFTKYVSHFLLYICFKRKLFINSILDLIFTETASQIKVSQLRHTRLHFRP